jgi:hypothetical protein
MLIYFIVFQGDTPDRIDLIVKSFTALLEIAESKGVVVVVTAGDQVGTVILMRLSALYELTI